MSQTRTEQNAEALQRMARRQRIRVIQEDVVRGNGKMYEAAGRVYEGMVVMALPYDERFDIRCDDGPRLTFRIYDAIRIEFIDD